MNLWIILLLLCGCGCNRGSCGCNHGCGNHKCNERDSGCYTEIGNGLGCSHQNSHNCESRCCEITEGCE